MIPKVERCPRCDGPMTWVSVIDYEGRDDPGTLRVVEVPWRWVLAEAVTRYFCGRHRGLGLAGGLVGGRLAYRLFMWAARRAEDASVEMFRVPFTPEVSAQVQQAIEHHEAAP